ncbi:anaphase-promoting complex subunit 11 isoform 1-T1 [Spinachia spinachia]
MVHLLERVITNRWLHRVSLASSLDCVLKLSAGGANCHGHGLYCGQTRMMKVKIRQWNGVASWLWVANDENCGICRMPFNGCCPDCKVPGDDCPLVWGQCSHCFHMHCILKWLNSQQVQQQCPMCRQEWKFKE